jgi:hypothetical protein
MASEEAAMGAAGEAPAAPAGGDVPLGEDCRRRQAAEQECAEAVDVIPLNVDLVLHGCATGSTVTSVRNKFIRFETPRGEQPRAYRSFAPTYETNFKLIFSIARDTEAAPAHELRFKLGLDQYLDAQLAVLRPERYELSGGPGFGPVAGALLSLLGSDPRVATDEAEPSSGWFSLSPRHQVADLARASLQAHWASLAERLVILTTAGPPPSPTRRRQVQIVCIIHGCTCLAAAAGNRRTP